MTTTFTTFAEMAAEIRRRDLEAAGTMRDDRKVAELQVPVRGRPEAQEPPELDDDFDLLRAAEELGIDLSGVRGGCMTVDEAGR